MKKVLLSITFFLFIPIIIHAEDELYLKDLQVLNGINTLPFNEKLDLYTILVNSDVDVLDLYYEAPENVSVTVIGNDYLEDGLNDIYINLTDGVNTSTYHLEVTKDSNTLYTFNPINNNSDFKEIKYLKYYVILGVIVINLIFFKILFIKRRKIK